MTIEKPSDIENLGIPDDDIVGWINDLRDGGFTQEEIDSMLVRLNQTYFDAKGSEVVEIELEKLKAEWWEKNRRKMNPDQEEFFRQGIISRIRRK